ncbi:MAG: hypothetical protein Q4A07_08225 [Coriobacteriales bacterium]|nr:hypothetical protein [Coriobacteriales bacterium]
MDKKRCLAIKSALALLCALVFALGSLAGCGSVEGTAPANDSASADNANETSSSTTEYLAEVTLEGGTGRASVTSPASVTIEGEQATVTIEWSSPHYDYMIVNGERYLPVNTEGNSMFQIPVLAFDEPFEVIADTTAMSQPHEITYHLTVASQD